MGDAKVILELRATQPTVLRTAKGDWYFEPGSAPVALPRPLTAAMGPAPESTPAS